MFYVFWRDSRADSPWWSNCGVRTIFIKLLWNVYTPAGGGGGVVAGSEICETLFLWGVADWMTGGNAC